jgi:hypothetical protein
MSYRSKLLSNKTQKREQELHVFTNPFLNSQQRLLAADDYEAPLTADTLSPNSKWIIVRNNIHKIRSWGGIDPSNVEQRYRDWYLFFQMRRELRRAHEHIRQIEHRPDFVPLQYFYLPTDETHVRRYDVSHVQPSDAIYYPGFDHEPIVLRSLLYYFSKECYVPYNSIFRTFLSDVCSIVYRDQQRFNRVSVLRKIALIITIILFIILGLMLFSLVLSVLKTTYNLREMYGNDPSGGIEWRQPETTLDTTVNSF